MCPSPTHQALLPLAGVGVQIAIQLVTGDSLGVDGAEHLQQQRWREWQRSGQGSTLQTFLRCTHALHCCATKQALPAVLKCRSAHYSRPPDFPPHRLLAIVVLRLHERAPDRGLAAARGPQQEH